MMIERKFDCQSIMKNTLIIITLLVVLFVLSFGAQREGFSSSIDIDKLKFGRISTKQKQLKARKIKSFALPLPLGTLPEPKPLSKLDKELRYLSKLTLTEVTQQQKKDSLGYSDRVLSHFIKFAGKHGLIYSDSHLKQVSDDLDSFGIRMKYMYSRPRPKQHSFLTGIPIETMGHVKTPSYPSLHTLKARVFADQLTYNNPKFKDKLDALATKIELSRLFGGYNYPSDNKAALVIAKALKPRIKYLEIVN